MSTNLRDGSLSVRTGVVLLLGWALAVVTDPASAGEQASSEARHWAFEPVARPVPPDVRHSELIANPIDAFLLSRLEQSNLSFSVPASRRELLRRAKFDLHGLPPTSEEIAEFLADQSPDSWEKLIDRLLASPHYGEHWGRYWLDVVRYAETAGYNADPHRPLAWKYRDYVIQAMNDDVPFARFIQEQLAGDEMFPDNPQSVLGTGYTLLWPDESNASNILLARQDSLNDLTANVGLVFLGLSVGCAQCHDHKFDPIPQRDFYRLQAFFSGIVRRESAPIGTRDQLAAYQQLADAWRSELQDVRTELHQLELEARIAASGDRRMKFPDVVLAAIDTPPENRTALQRQYAFWCERQIEVTEEQLVARLSDVQKQRRAELRKQVAEWQSRRPQPPVEIAGMIVGELQETPPRTHLLAGGNYDKPQDEVQPGFLSALFAPGQTDANVVPPTPQSSGRRSALAGWLSDPRHPLVPRVFVNRIWQGHFGRGLVENANDFGTQQRTPLHRELLDWLTSEFIAPELPQGTSPKGSLKHLHRLILCSTAYRQSTHRHRSADPVSPASAVDPENQWYWHFPRQRLRAESVRDAMLAASGLLNPALHGPSVWPELPADFSKREAWRVSSNPADRWRRSVYIHAKRNLPYPLLESFDLPDMHESCARRTQTTVAPQALMLLNGDLVLNFARGFAGRLLSDNPHADLPPLVTSAYLLALGREPEPDELAAGIAFIDRQASIAGERLPTGEPLLLPRGFPKFLDPALGAAITDFCHALFNSNEFVYVD